MIRVFISSVQKEFAEERKALVKYIREDVLLCKFFQPFIFEELQASMTTVKLKQLHSSVPVNPILAVPAYLAGYIEHSGTGTTDIVDYCTQVGLREPEFIQDEDFRVVIWRKTAILDGPQNEFDYKDVTDFGVHDGSQNGPQNGPQKSTAERCRALLETIISNPSITKEELGVSLHVSESTVKRDIDRLRESYRIVWIGPSKGGRWEVKFLK